MASPQLQWMVIKNNSCFLMKARNCNTAFSKEPHNLKNLNTYKYNGLIHRQTVGVLPASDGKGIVLEISKCKKFCKPVKKNVKLHLKKDNRSIIKTTKKNLKGKVSEDLQMAAVRRACAILKSQKPIPQIYMKRKLVALDKN